MDLTSPEEIIQSFSLHKGLPAQTMILHMRVPERQTPHECRRAVEKKTAPAKQFCAIL